MSKIVRSSKYRHVFGTVAKKEDCYDELKISRNAWDSNLAAASPAYIAYLVESAGGGAFGAIPWSTTGKINPNTGVVSGHKGPVLDLDFNPFNDHMIASASEDCYVKIWILPEGGLKENINEPVQDLRGHKKKVGVVKFNPIANNILATGGCDPSLKIWDIEAGKTVSAFDEHHTDLVLSVDWNYSGKIVATMCKDKHLRVFDPRSHKVEGDVADAHGGTKGGRAVFLGKREKILTTGFTKSTERDYALWDPRNLSTPISRTNVDSASGVLMPFFDDDTGVLFLAGKGDGNIRYYEVVDNDIHFLTEFKTATPQRGIAIAPKRMVNVSDCEIVRMLKVSVKTIEPISFQVPRKSDVFQNDIFPDCFSGEPSLTSAEWLSGRDGEPKTVSLAGGYVVKQQAVAFNPTVAEPEKPMTEFEMKQEIERLTKRVNHLEGEIIKKDVKIKELSNN